MLSTLNSSSEQFLNAVNRIQARLTLAQNQVASGLRVTKASDDPDAVGAILQIHADIARNTQIQGQLATLKTEADTSEQTLSSAVTLMEQASVIATQATGTLQTAATRNTLAGQVQALLEQMVSISQTSSGGRYLFSGDQDQVAPYDLDLTSGNGVVRQVVSDDTRKVELPSGATFTAGRSANTIFDHRNADDTYADDNVFAALNNLRLALLNNDDTAIKDAIEPLNTASEYLNDQLGFYGTVQSRIGAGLDDAENISLRLQTELSKKRDADAVEAIQEMSLANTQLQAAMQVKAKISTSSLFQYL